MLSFDIDLLWTVLNVLCLCILVRIFLFKPIHKILDERQKLVDKDLADAAAAKAEAEEYARTQKEFMAGMEEEKKKAIDESTAEAMKVYEDIVANANDEAKEILKKAEFDAMAQKDAILRQTQGEIRELVLEATARVVGARTGSDSDLYDQFLEKAGGSNDE